MSPAGRLFLRNGGAAALSGAAVVLLASREALAQSAMLFRQIVGRIERVAWHPT